MGCKFFGNKSWGDTYKVNPINPDPNKFKIKKTQTIEGLWITLVNYPNCTNFEGNKILVTTYDVRSKKILDPHFSGKDSGLVARFEPTKLGWDLAINFAKNI